MACRLAALDKEPGVCPVGMGETHRRLMAKCVVAAIGDSATISCGNVNLCAGLSAGIEGALHAMVEAPEFLRRRSEEEGAETTDVADTAPQDDDPGEGQDLLPGTQSPEQGDAMATTQEMETPDDPVISIMLDARNGFNELGRKAMFWTVRHRWAAGARFAFDCYRHQCKLTLRQRGKPCHIILSREGVTQGDPLSMILYGIGLLPLAEKLRGTIPQAVQPWYADDSAMTGPASKVRQAVMLLQQWGPRMGHCPEPAKSIVVCPIQDQDRVRAIMADLPVKYREGHRCVGGFLGCHTQRSEWLDPQILKWRRAVQQLARIARRYPQTAHAGLTMSLQSEWQCLQRVTSGVRDAHAPIEAAIVEEFLPALFDLPKEEVEHLRPLLSLSVRCAGLGIRSPTETAEGCYATSKACTRKLVDSLLEGTDLDVLGYLREAGLERRAAVKERQEQENDALQALLLTYSPAQQRRLQRVAKAASWLSTAPNRLNGAELSAEEFRDSLRIRYGFEPPNLPSRCDGCNSKFSVEHALSCKKGGLVLLRHNEVAGEWHQLCAAAFSPSAVSDEPFICSGQHNGQEAAAAPANPEVLPPEARGDVAVRGFWKRGTAAIFDMRVVDTDAATHRSQDPAKVLAGHEKRKKNRYLEPCLARRRQFTPLVFSVDGLPGEEAKAAMQRVASRLAAKWKRPHSQLCGYVRSRVAHSLVRATSLCLRGARDPTARNPAPHWESGHGLALY